jgi:hypothetical protein
MQGSLSKNPFEADGSAQLRLGARDKTDDDKSIDDVRINDDDGWMRSNDSAINDDAHVSAGRDSLEGAHMRKPDHVVVSLGDFLNGSSLVAVAID